MVNKVRVHINIVRFSILTLGIIFLAACGQQQAPRPVSPPASQTAITQPSNESTQHASPTVESVAPAPSNQASAPPVSPILPQKPEPVSPTASSSQEPVKAVESPKGDTTLAQASKAEESSKMANDKDSKQEPTQQQSSANEPAVASSSQETAVEDTKVEVAEVVEVEDVSNLDALDDTFFLEILLPEEDPAFVEDPSYIVLARTRIDAAVSVNDELVDIDEDGILEAEVALEEGPNIIEVVASIESGEEESAVLTVFYLPEEGG